MTLPSFSVFGRSSARTLHASGPLVNPTCPRVSVYQSHFLQETLPDLASSRSLAPRATETLTGYSFIFVFCLDSTRQGLDLRCTLLCVPSALYTGCAQ